MRKRGTACLFALLLSGCVTASTDVVHFVPTPQQQALMRDGQSVIVSRAKNSIVTIRPATRAVQNGRPIFIVNIQNVSRQPLEVRLANVSAEQMVAGNTRELKVFSYDELVQEEQQAHTGRVVVAALAAGMNSYSAGNHYWRQVNASNQNAELAATVAATHERNLAALEQLAIKDDTILPGETYGGRLVIQGPESDTALKTYNLSIAVGPDVHRIQVSQGPSVS